MPLETLDDIIEELANEFMIYGTHTPSCNENNLCRVCYTLRMKERILRAVEIERKLSGAR